MSPSDSSREDGAALGNGSKDQCQAKMADMASDVFEASQQAGSEEFLDDNSACSDLVSFGSPQSEEGYLSASGDSQTIKGSRNKRKFRSETPPLPGTFSGDEAASAADSGVEVNDCSVRKVMDEAEELEVSGSRSLVDEGSSGVEDSMASQVSAESRPTCFPDDMRMRMNWKWLCQNISNTFLRPGTPSNSQAGEGESSGISEASQQKDEAASRKADGSLSCASELSLKETFQHADSAVGAGVASLSADKVQRGFEQSMGGEKEQKPAHIDFFAGTEYRLEEILLVKLDTIYNDAITKIVAKGYDYKQAKEVVSKYGSCYGEKDALTNTVDNALHPRDRDCAASSLEELQKESLRQMINAVQAVRGPQETKGEAMWRLLMCDLDLNKACEIEPKVCAQRASAVESPAAPNVSTSEPVHCGQAPTTAAGNFNLAASFSPGPQAAASSSDCCGSKGLPTFPVSTIGRPGPAAEQEVQITAAQVANGQNTGVQLSWSLKAGKDGGVTKQSTPFGPGVQNGKMQQQGSSLAKEPVFSAVKGVPGASSPEGSDESRSKSVMATPLSFPASSSGPASKGKQRTGSTSGKASVQAAKEELAKSLTGFRGLEGSDSAPAVVKACMEAILGAGIPLPPHDGNLAGSAASTMAGLQAAVEAVAAQAAGQGLDPVQLAGPVARQMAGHIASQVLGCSLGQTPWMGDLQTGNMQEQQQQQSVRQHDVSVVGTAEYTAAPAMPHVAPTAFLAQGSSDQFGLSLPVEGQQLASDRCQADVKAQPAELMPVPSSGPGSHARLSSHPGTTASGTATSSTADATLGSHMAVSGGQNGSGASADSRITSRKHANGAGPALPHDTKARAATAPQPRYGVVESSQTSVSGTGVPPAVSSSAASLGNNSEEEGMESVAGVMAKFEQLNATHAAVLEQCVLLEKRVVELEAQSDDKRDQKQLQLEGRVQELERQVDEGKQWAQERVMQAARKLLKDQAELKALRAEREEGQRVKKERAVLEDSTMKKLADMEAALRKASGQVDRANAAVRRLETENAEFRAEMQAANLRANEVAGKMAESAKREGRAQKKAQAWERQKKKLEEELAEEKRKLQAASKEASQAKERQQQAEVRSRQEVKAKEEVVAMAEAEKRARELAEVAAKRREETLRKKAEADARRFREDLHRLEQEVTQLRVAAGASVWGPNGAGGHGAEPTAEHGFGASPAGMHSALGSMQALREANSRLLRELAEVQEPNNVQRDRECVMCMSEEMSVVFLPCAHLVVCSSCNELHKRQGMDECPSCRTPIQQRIRVYGAS